MKKLTALLLILCLVFALAACSDSKTLRPSGTDTSDAADNSDTATEEQVYTTQTTADGVNLGLDLDTGMKEKLDQLEYTLYYNLFYNNDTSEVGKTLTKEGTFAVLKDAYNDVERYYVWGYMDNTKCCSYQWEFVMPEGTDIPESGSYVTMTGKLVKDDKALDGYRFTDVALKVEEPFKNAGFDFDMTTLSPVLNRVQIINIQQYPEQFNGKTLRLFGRALSLNTIQDPYYDNSWAMDFDGENKKMAIGDNIFIKGTITAENGGCYIKTDKINIVK